MNPNRKPPRRRKATPQPEMLESRALMTSGAGNTFAIMEANVAAPNQTVAVPFNYVPSLITLTPKHQITLGIDVAANSGSKVVPKIVGVIDAQTHQMIPMTRGTYTKAVQRTNPAEGAQTTAVLVTLHIPAGAVGKTHSYDALVQGIKGTTGAVLVGFYLPGDATGKGGVTVANVATISALKNVSASSPTYGFAFDSNRDGVINGADIKSAQQNIGVAVNITPVVSANLNPASDSGIQDRITNIQNVEFDGTATPGSTITFTDTNNISPITTTTANSLGQYSLHIPLGPGDNTYKVSATDPFGQIITGTIAAVTYSLNAPVPSTPVIPKQPGVTS